MIDSYTFDSAEKTILLACNPIKFSVIRIQRIGYLYSIASKRVGSCLIFQVQSQRFLLMVRKSFTQKRKNNPCVWFEFEASNANYWLMARKCNYTGIDRVYEERVVFESLRLECRQQEVAWHSIWRNASSWIFHVSMFHVYIPQWRRSTPKRGENSLVSLHMTLRQMRQKK
jgi:dipeptidyl-peptidase-4